MLPGKAPADIMRKIKDDAKKETMRDKLYTRDPTIPIKTKPNFLINIPVIIPLKYDKSLIVIDINDGY